jgi:hypothetical protein
MTAFCPSLLAEIKETFAAAAEALAEVCEDLDANQAALGAEPLAGPPTAVPAATAHALPQQAQQAGCPLLAGVIDVEAAVGRTPQAAKARAAQEAKAAAKSQRLLHERIRTGVAVGRGVGGTPVLTQKQKARAAKLAAKSERKQRIREQSEAYLTGQRVDSGSKRRQGSRRGAAVEAAWGNKRGQYREADGQDDGEDWSLRKQKKGKKKASNKDGASPANSGKKRQRKGKAEGGKPKKKKARKE